MNRDSNMIKNRLSTQKPNSNFLSSNSSHNSQINSFRNTNQCLTFQKRITLNEEFIICLFDINRLLFFYDLGEEEISTSDIFENAETIEVISISPHKKVSILAIAFVSYFRLIELCLEDDRLILTKIKAVIRLNTYSVSFTWNSQNLLFLNDNQIQFLSFKASSSNSSIQSAKIDVFASDCSEIEKIEVSLDSKFILGLSHSKIFGYDMYGSLLFRLELKNYLQFVTVQGFIISSQIASHYIPNTKDFESIEPEQSISLANKERDNLISISSEIERIELNHLLLDNSLNLQEINNIYENPANSLMNKEIHKNRNSNDFNTKQICLVGVDYNENIHFLLLKSSKQSNLFRLVKKSIFYFSSFTEERMQIKCAKITTSLSNRYISITLNSSHILIFEFNHIGEEKTKVQTPGFIKVAHLKFSEDSDLSFVRLLDTEILIQHVLNRGTLSRKKYNISDLHWQNASSFLIRDDSNMNSYLSDNEVVLNYEDISETKTTQNIFSNCDLRGEIYKEQAEKRKTNSFHQNVNLSSEFGQYLQSDIKKKNQSHPKKYPEISTNVPKIFSKEDLNHKYFQSNFDNTNNLNRKIVDVKNEFMHSTTDSNIGKSEVFKTVDCLSTSRFEINKLNQYEESETLETISFDQIFKNSSEKLVHIQNNFESVFFDKLIIKSIDLNRNFGSFEKSINPFRILKETMPVYSKELESIVSKTNKSLLDQIDIVERAIEEENQNKNSYCQIKEIENLASQAQKNLKIIESIQSENISKFKEVNYLMNDFHLKKNDKKVMFNSLIEKIMEQQNSILENLDMNDQTCKFYNIHDSNPCYLKIENTKSQHIPYKNWKIMPLSILQSIILEGESNSFPKSTFTKIINESFLDKAFPNWQDPISDKIESTLFSKGPFAKITTENLIDEPIIAENDDSFIKEAKEYPKIIIDTPSLHHSLIKEACSLTIKDGSQPTENIL